MCLQSLPAIPGIYIVAQLILCCGCLLGHGIANGAGNGVVIYDDEDDYGYDPIYTRAPVVASRSRWYRPAYTRRRERPVIL
jgi:hypothetical protein